MDELFVEEMCGPIQLILKIFMRVFAWLCDRPQVDNGLVSVGLRVLDRSRFLIALARTCCSYSKLLVPMLVRPPIPRSLTWRVSYQR